MANELVLPNWQSINAAREAATQTIYPPQQHGATFNQAAESYLRHGGEARYLGPILEYFDQRPLNTIFPFDLTNMAETLYPWHSGATRNRQAITPARAVIMHGYNRGWCNGIKVKRFKQDKPKRHKPASVLWHHLFTRQCDEENKYHLAAVVMFMGQTGARISEAINLHWSEVDLTARTALLLKTKTDKNSMRYLTDELAGRLRKLQTGTSPDERVFRYKGRHSVSDRMKAVCERANIDFVPPHSAGRRHFANRGLELGLPIKTVMEGGGWESIVVFMEAYVKARVNSGRIIADAFGREAYETA